MTNPIGAWLLISWLAKKAIDGRKRWVSEAEYRRMQLEADQRDGKTQKSLTDARIK